MARSRGFETIGRASESGEMRVRRAYVTEETAGRGRMEKKKEKWNDTAVVNVVARFVQRHLTVSAVKRLPVPR